MTMNDTDLKYPFIFLISLLFRKQKYLSIIARNRTERENGIWEISWPHFETLFVYIFIVYSSLFILYKPMKNTNTYNFFIKIEAPAFNSSRYATNSFSVFC